MFHYNPLFLAINIVILVSLFLQCRFAYSLTKDRKRLEADRRELSAANQRLMVSNQLLTQKEGAKEQCIMNLVMRCSGYHECLENFRKRCLTLVKSRNNGELLDMLKNESSLEGDDFINQFDTTLLSIYPDFVTKFNALLRPDEQIVLKKDEKLNTELRIFALMRLGIYDPKQIAQFLGYTTTTIYTYSSRVRSKSDLTKEEFDARVMKI